MAQAGREQGASCWRVKLVCGAVKEACITMAYIPFHLRDAKLRSAMAAGACTYLSSCSRTVTAALFGGAAGLFGSGYQLVTDKYCEIDRAMNCSSVSDCSNPPQSACNDAQESAIYDKRQAFFKDSVAVSVPVGAAVGVAAAGLVGAFMGAHQYRLAQQRTSETAALLDASGNDRL